MGKYLAIFKFNLKSELNFKADYIFSLLSFAIHVFVFNALWNYILQGKMIEGYGKTQLIWYIIIGEFLAYSIGKKNYIKVSDMIKNGDVANILTKPLSFMKYILANEATSIVNIGVNLIFAVVLGLIMAGPIKLEAIQVILFIISIIISFFMDVFLYVFIGMLAFLTEENKSFYMVISKAMLLLIFTPLEFFPIWVQNILRFLPTTYIVYPPGKIFVNFDIKSAIFLIICQIFAFLVVYLAVYAINKKGVKNINVNGG